MGNLEKKALILSCNTGAGHNSCAKAVKEAFENHGIICDTMDGLEMVSPALSQFLCNWHVRLYRHMPALSDLGYRFCEDHPELFYKKSPAYKILTSDAIKMQNAIEEGHYSYVICPHVFPALTLGHLHDDLDPAVKTAFIATDYSCSPITDQLNLDYYFIPDADLKDQFVAAGLAPESVIPSGIPVRREFYEKGNKEEAKKSLGLDPAKKHLLMMSGSMGCGPIEKITRVLMKRLDPSVNLTIVCGTNEKLTENLSDICQDSPNIHVMGFVDNICQLMDSSDLYLTKPGGLSTTEATAKGLPMVLVDAVGGCEESNLKFFLDKGTAISDSSPGELANACIRLLSDTEALEAMQKKCSEKPVENAAQKIFQTMTGIE